MSKLYIFAIGGTGSRVIRSLTMMLASGVKMGVDEIVPMIIDPDVSNADLRKTVILLDNYLEINKKMTSPQNSENRFFKTKISKYTKDYTLPIDNINSQSFEKFIGIGNLNAEDEAMVRMLFSAKNLKSSMDVGFKGNPNIGSVVLNEVLDSDVFKQFDSSFTSNDKIFIVSSIFGGTGASGFPMLLKALRESKAFKNSQTINSATIGAITVLPYFTVGVDKDGKDEVNSATFASKTKSALKYYEDNIANNNIIDSLYFLGDTKTQQFDYSVGGNTQSNEPHLIEFMAATAAIHFSFQSIIPTDQPRNTSCYELGIDEPGQNDVSFTQFGNDLRKDLRRPLTQFVLMANTLDNYIDYLENDLAATKELNEFYNSDFFKILHTFTKTFKEWLSCMEKNNRSLKLFNLDCGQKPFDVVNGKSPETNLIERMRGSGYNRFATVLNEVRTDAQKVVKGSDSTYFLELFFRATEKLAKEKFKF
jgi:hypothetical protein